MIISGTGTKAGIVPVSRAPQATAENSVPQDVATLTAVAPLVQTAPSGRPLDRSEVTNALTLRAVTLRLGEELPESVRKELRENADLAGVLCGVMNSVSLPLSEPQEQEALRNLAGCQSLAAGQHLAALPDPHQPGHFLILNNANFSWKLHEVRWGKELKPETWTAAAAAKVESWNAENRPRAQALLAITQTAPEGRPPSERTPRQLAMISYVTSEEQLQRCGRVLVEWRENFQQFGHQHMQARLCDDSPEPFGSRLQELAEKNGFIYVGPAEKAALRLELEKRLQQHMSLDDARQVAALVAGPGATQNRNLSLQMLGKSGGLQMDHDMTPEILTAYCDRPIPYDIVSRMESAPEHQISSFNFTGAMDVSIDTILAQPLGPLNRNSEPPAPYRMKSDTQLILGNAVRGPMHVPAKVPAAARLAPGLRDGDLALTTFSERLGGACSSGLADSVYHRDPAGGRWGGANLLRQYLIYEMVNAVAAEALPWQDGGLPPAQAGQLLLERLQSDKPWPTVADSACYQRGQKSLETYDQERRRGLEEVGLALQGLDSSQAASVAGMWKSGASVKEARAELEGLRDRLEGERGAMRRLQGPALDGDLQREAREVLRIQALALRHFEVIQDVLAKPWPRR